MEEVLLDVTGFALVPGPAEIAQPLYSFEVDEELVYHPPDEVAANLLAIPGMRPCNTAAPASEGWATRWEERGRSLDLDFTLMEPGDGRVVWGGSNLRGCCRVSDVLRIWAALSRRFQGVWLHDRDCRLWTPEEFARRFGGQAGD